VISRIHHVLAAAGYNPPEEVRFHEAFDGFSLGVKELVDMPDREIARLRGFLQHGNGRLIERFEPLSNDGRTAVSASGCRAMTGRDPPWTITFSSRGPLAAWGWRWRVSCWGAALE
jgi:hypothetical protein